MNKIQALYVARKVLDKLDKNPGFFDEKSESDFEREYGVSHAQIVNALPIIEAMETVEGASYGNR